MEPRQNRSLVLAGTAVGIAIAMWSASATIAIVAAARPPVYEYLSAEQNQAFARELRSNFWIMPAITLFLSIFMLAQVVLRRPLGTTIEQLAKKSAFRSALRFEGAVVWTIIAVGALFVLRSVVSSIALLSSNGAKPITDSTAFPGLGNSLGLLCLMCCMASNMFMLDWIRQSLRATPESKNPLAAAPA